MLLGVNVDIFRYTTLNAADLTCKYIPWVYPLHFSDCIRMCSAWYAYGMYLSEGQLRNSSILLKADDLCKMNATPIYINALERHSWDQ